MKICHFYHAFSGPYWQPAVEDHIECLSKANIPFDLSFAGVLGNDEQLQQTLSYSGLFHVVGPVFGKWEQATMKKMLQVMQKLDDDDVIFYAHSKGARYLSPKTVPWRRNMLKYLFEDWEHVLDLFSSGHDVIGCNWVRDLPPNNYFMGNFWAAKVSHLKRLPNPIPTNSRYDAESWIGTVEPSNVVDLTPGIALYPSD